MVGQPIIGRATGWVPELAADTEPCHAVYRHRRGPGSHPSAHRIPFYMPMSDDFWEENVIYAFPGPH